MPARKSIHAVSKELKTKVDKAGQYWFDKQPADLGNYAGKVVVPDSTNLVYARLANGQVVQVFNSMAPNIYNWKVTIGRDKSQPSLLKVLEVRWVYNIKETIAYVLFHHKQHEYPAPDTVWIWRDQFLPLLVLPNGGFNVRLFGDVIFTATMTSPLVVPNTDLDLTSYHPAGFQAYYILLEAKTDGTINVVQGADYGSVDALRAVAPIPTPTPGNFPICVIEMYEGQTEIRRDSTVRNIIDLRNFTSAAIPNSGFQWHSSTQVNNLNDSDEFGVYNTISSLLEKITWFDLKQLLTNWIMPTIPYQALARWSGASGQTTFDFPDVAESISSIKLNGLEEDPLVYNLSADGTQLVLDTALPSATTVTAIYNVRRM